MAENPSSEVNQYYGVRDQLAHDTSITDATTQTELDSSEASISYDYATAWQQKRYPLHAAASRGHLAVAKLLLEHDADVNAEDELGCTALHHAVRQRHGELVKHLVLRGAKIDSQDHNGCTAMFYAADRGYEDMVISLLSCGAQVN